MTSPELAEPIMSVYLTVLLVVERKAGQERCSGDWLLESRESAHVPRLVPGREKEGSHGRSQANADC